MGCPRQANVAKGRIRSRELGVTVGGHIDAGEALVIEHKSERQRDVRYCVIAVIAGVSRAWHDTAADLNYRKTPARYRRRGRCRCRRWRGAGCRRWSGRRCRHIPRSLNYNRHWPAGLEEAHC